PRRHEGPQCGGARRLTCGSLTGDSKRGRAAAPLFVAWRYPPSWGGRSRWPRTTCVGVNRPPGPQSRTGGATYRAADGPPFVLRTKAVSSAASVVGRGEANSRSPGRAYGRQHLGDQTESDLPRGGV